MLEFHQSNQIKFKPNGGKYAVRYSIFPWQSVVDNTLWSACLLICFVSILQYYNQYISGVFCLLKVEELVESKEREERERKAESRRETSLKDMRLQVENAALTQ